MAGMRALTSASERWQAGSIMIIRNRNFMRLQSAPPGQRGTWKKCTSSITTTKRTMPPGPRPLFRKSCTKNIQRRFHQKSRKRNWLMRNRVSEERPPVSDRFRSRPRRSPPSAHPEIGFENKHGGESKKKMPKPLGLKRLEDLAKRIRICVKCPLHASRTKAVPGEGKPTAKVMVIGEAPGKQEDQTGRPFVGNPGRTLDHVIEGPS